LGLPDGDDSPSQRHGGRLKRLIGPRGVTRGVAAIFPICALTGHSPSMPREERIKAAQNIVAEAQTPTTGPQLMDRAPKDPEATLLLFCPEQAGWQTGQWREGRWLSTACLELELKPTHWMPAPREPTEYNDIAAAETRTQGDDESAK
jgi:hypothetical protein